ncbi:MAG: hypothetical protein M1819_000762 [Sarea resinae]|nr:MAG: hypothetical protein M1819_000762 [Sarea resinae]
MSYFLPSSFQKRLLRYALSRLELLDTDALDLEKLDIAWGKRSTVELRDVGLKLQKLSSLLQLSGRFDLVKARILLLRVTIPADIYNSSISVEVEGVVVQINIVEPGTSSTSHHSPAEDGQSSRSGASRRTTGVPESDSTSGDADLPEEVLPTTEHLAQSFLETEPPTERAELQAAITSQSQYLHQSVTLSEDGEEEVSMGTGTGLSLPGFLAGFLKGVGDRLVVKIKDVEISADFSLYADGQSTSGTANDVTIRISVDKVDVDAVKNKDSHSKEDGTDSQEQANPVERRFISFYNIRVHLISDSSLFAGQSPVSLPVSPTITHSSRITEQSTSQTSPDTRDKTEHALFQSSDGRSSAPSTSSSTDSLKQYPARGHQEEIIQPSLEGSVMPSESGRFSDASDGDDNHSAILSRSQHLTFSRSEDGDALDTSVYLDDALEHSSHEEGTARLLASSVSSSSALAPQSQELRSEPRQSSLRLAKSDNSDSPSMVENERSSSNALLSSQVSDSMSSAKEPNEMSTSDPLAFDSHAVYETSHGDGYDQRDYPRSELSRDIESPDTESPSGEDLSESKFFSHEEAESMYLSALTNASGMPSQRMTIPGAWGPSSTSSDISAAAVAIDNSSQSHLQNEKIFSPVKAATSGNIGEERSATPRPSLRTSTGGIPLIDGTLPRASPTQSGYASNNSEQTSDPARLSKEIVLINQIIFSVPSSGIAPAEDQAEEGSQSQESKDKLDWQHIATGTPSSNLPGTFSTYARREPIESSSYRSGSQQLQERRRVSFSPNASHRSRNPVPDDKSEGHCQTAIELIIGSASVKVDLGAARLFSKCGQQLLLASNDRPSQQSIKEGSDLKKTQTIVRIEHISVKLVEHLEAGTVFPNSYLPEENSPGVSPTMLSDTILSADVKGSTLKTIGKELFSTTKLSIKTFRLGYAAEDIISFDAGLRLKASTKDLSQHDISIEINSSKDHRQINITTLPIHISLDLHKLDETISCFGGFSSILELGSSVASTATIIGASSGTQHPPKRSRTVRFDSSINKDPSKEPSLGGRKKANVRIGGILLDLVGRVCALKLEASAVKVVGREEGVGLQIDKVKLNGPRVLREGRGPSANVDFGDIRIEYLPKPQEVDLGRLLSLLNPSKDKYDHDGDILLDTLLRQRQQGSVLRTTVSSATGSVSNLDDLENIRVLSEELAKFSTVAKYLPDDDRPGIMTLGLIKNLDFDVTVSEDFGSVQLGSENIEAAYVGLPSLVAVAINKISLHRINDEELIGEALASPQPASRASSPMFMARVIGDEMEPTVRIKIWNLRAEYRVTTIMAAMGISEQMLTEEVVKEMLSSAATLTGFGLQNQPRPEPSSQRSSVCDRSGTLSRASKIDISLRDCVIGLNPRDIPCKGLIVLAETRLSGQLPKADAVHASLEIKRAYLLAIDDVANVEPRKEVRMAIHSPSSTTGNDQVSALCDTGYVSLSYISSAMAIISSSKAESGNVLDIELKDDLFVLESCADSTQTLLSIMNGLKPPMPPSRDIKYRTEIIPVQDMLASLSGDAFAPSGKAHNEEVSTSIDPEDEYIIDDVDELSYNFDYVTNFPRNERSSSSGLAIDVPGTDLYGFEGGDMDRVVERQAPLEGLQEGYAISSDSDTLDFREHHFDAGSTMEGTAHRWDSTRNTYGSINDRKVRDSPLKVRVRNVHFIWNLFDGYDWPKTRDTISKAVKDVEDRATERRARHDRRPSFDSDEEEESVIGDFLFNSIYIGIPANRDPRELSERINHDVDDLVSENESYPTSTVPTSTISQSPNRHSQKTRARGKRLRLHRSKQHKMAFELKGVSADFIVFPQGSGETQSSLDVRVYDFEIYDHLPTSTWKKFATYMRDAGERETGKDMVHLEILNVKPVPDLAASEIVVKATILPLRLHVDQDALDFITRFFEFKDDTVPVHNSSSEVPFLQRVEVQSVRLKLDYKPKSVDYAGLRSGHTTEFMNFFILDQADMVLRHVIIYGVSGFDKLSKTLNDIWMPDIKRNQLPGVLAGLAPVRSLVNVGGGVRDLVVVPMREYKKDGRIVRSIQKGALAFARTTTSELVKLGAKLAIGTQTALQGAETFLNSPSQGEPPGWDDDDIEEEKKVISLYADQPIGVAQGLRGAYASLERDLLTAKDAIVAVPGEVLESGSAQGAAKAILMRAPTVIFRPAIGASKAISQTLMGATNSLDPQHRRRLDDKYKKH